jgi:hypothetical protein
VTVFLDHLVLVTGVRRLQIKQVALLLLSPIVRRVGDRSEGQVLAAEIIRPPVDGILALVDANRAGVDVNVNAQIDARVAD